MVLSSREAAIKEGPVTDTFFYPPRLFTDGERVEEIIPEGVGTHIEW
jgi:hypothetical protein